MWRSIFMALGITFCIVGVECMVFDEAVIAKPALMSGAEAGGATAQQPIQTKEWMPWSFLFAGAVIILYTITLPKRFHQG
jgi:hypothetical protein